VVAERGPHIMDPYTGQPTVGLASVTVVGTRLATVDACATAAFAMGLRARDWVESLNGYEAFGIILGGAAWQARGSGPTLADSARTGGQAKRLRRIHQMQNPARARARIPKIAVS
jgi:hypothetical protein